MSQQSSNLAATTPSIHCYMRDHSSISERRRNWSCPDFVERLSLCDGHFGLAWGQQFVSQCGMSPTWIVEAVDISAKGQFRSSSGLEAGSPDQLVLDRLEHCFHHRVEAPMFVKRWFGQISVHRSGCRFRELCSASSSEWFRFCSFRLSCVFYIGKVRGFAFWRWPRDGVQH